MKKISKILSIFAGMALILLLVVSAIRVCAFDKGLYHTLFEKHEVDKMLSMSMEDIDKVTDVLVDYCAGKRDNLDVMVEIQGTSRPFFNEKEISHMQDVQILFRTALYINTLSAIGFIVFFALAGRSAQWNFAIIFRYMLYGMGILLALIAAILLYAALDFSNFWTLFHKVFMWNDLWMLDPATDLLIVLMPLGFFFDICFAIVKQFAVLLFACIVVGILVNYLVKKEILFPARSTQ